VESSISFPARYDRFASIGELNGVPDEVDHDLHQSSPIAVACRQFSSHIDLECELLVGGQRLQCTMDGPGNILQ
jgi:hypothetical protein